MIAAIQHNVPVSSRQTTKLRFRSTPGAVLCSALQRIRIVYFLWGRPEAVLNCTEQIKSDRKFETGTAYSIRPEKKTSASQQYKAGMTLPVGVWGCMENGNQVVRVGLSELNYTPLSMCLYMSENEEDSVEKKNTTQAHRAWRVP